MQRTGFRGLACLMVCLAVGATAMAQGPGRGRGGLGRGFGGPMGGPGGMGASFLLGIEQVQKELKISDDQKTKLAALNEGGPGPGPGGFPAFQEMSEEERQKFFADMRKRMDERNQKATAILDADQAKRLKEIRLQVAGNAVLADAEVATELKLTDEQKDQVKTITEATNARRGELFQPGGDREAMREKMQQLQKDADEEYLGVLTDEQKTQFTKMKGTEFKLDRSAFGRGFGGFGGPGGPGGRRRGGNDAKN